jgi:hypothetical protein
MLPADWQQYVAQKSREIGQRPENAPKKPQGVGKGVGGRRLMSRRQAAAFAQTANPVRAIYQEVNEFNQAQVRKNRKGFTTDLGGNCEADIPHGKRTR